MQFKTGLQKFFGRGDIAPPYISQIPFRSANISANTENGSKAFELSNHLGNVLAVVSDKKRGFSDGSTADNYVDDYKAEVVSVNDYYPFGMAMPERSFDSPKYRYGFNGKEKDESGEWGELTHYDYGARIYNPGIGRWMSKDPLFSWAPGWTPYRFGFDNPINYTDPDGLFESRRDARRYRRDARRNGNENIGGGSIVKNSRGSFDIRNGEGGAVSRNSDGLVESFAIGRAVHAIRQREAGFWERRKSGGLLSQVLYNSANGVNVFARGWFTPRGGDIRTLDGFSIVKGSNEGVMAGVDGALTLSPLQFLSRAKTVMKPTNVEGVYQYTTTIGNYVGQSKDMLRRYLEHFFSKKGKFKGSVLKDGIFTAMPGSTQLEREIYEQYMINKIGIQNLKNVVNPMGGRMEVFRKNVDSVIQKFNLPK